MRHSRIVSHEKKKTFCRTLMERGLHSTGDQEFIYGDRDDRNQSKSSCISPGTEQEVTLGSQFGAMSQLVKPRIKTDDGIFGLEKIAETIGPVPPCRRIEC